MLSKRTAPALIVALAALCLLQAPVFAQTRLGSLSSTSPFFPLHVGDEWVYSRTGATGTGTWKVEVTDRVTAANGRAYLSLAGYFFGAPRLVRSNLVGTVTEFNPDGTYDNLWYLLGAPVGATWQIQLEPQPILSPVADCVSGSKLTLASRQEIVRVPAGEFKGVVRIDFRSPCADAGILSEWFAPGVGLVRRVESSFAGPIVSELVQAEVGDLVLPRLPYSTTLGLDSPMYVNNLMPPIGPNSLPVVKGTFVVRNRTSVPVEFFFCGVGISIEVRNDRGEVVVRASAPDCGSGSCDCVLWDQGFKLVNDALVVPFSFKLQTVDGTPLPDGSYSVTATLNSFEAPALRPSASAKIEVRSIH